MGSLHPWETEPDRVEWRYKGFPCLILRSAVTGALCGYVGVPSGHPWYKVPYGDVDADVHGGLTYSNECHGKVCHKAEPGEPDDLWWLGFDCAHAWDYSPNLGMVLPDAVYRTMDYVHEQTQRLADQAAAQ